MARRTGRRLPSSSPSSSSVPSPSSSSLFPPPSSCPGKGPPLPRRPAHACATETVWRSAMPPSGRPGPIHPHCFGGSRLARWLSSCLLRLLSPPDHQHTGTVSRCSRCSTFFFFFSYSIHVNRNRISYLGEYIINVCEHLLSKLARILLRNIVHQICQSCITINPHQAMQVQHAPMVRLHSCVIVADLPKYSLAADSDILFEKGRYFAMEEFGRANWISRQHMERSEPTRHLI